MAAREMEHIDRDYERLWRREDESIPQFIPIRPRAGGWGARWSMGVKPHMLSLIQVHGL